MFNRYPDHKYFLSIDLNVLSIKQPTEMLIRSLHTPALAILLLLFISPSLNAGTIYQWTDQSGVLHITNLPPPKGTKIQEVVQYKEKTAKEIQQDKLVIEQERQERLQQKKTQDTQDAEIRAKEARKKADEAKADAEQAIQQAQEQVEKYSTKKKKKRKKYRNRVRKAIQAAEKAEAQANEAATKANQAENEALDAAKQAQGAKSQKR